MTEGTNLGIACLHFKQTPSLASSLRHVTPTATLRKADVENKPGRLRDSETKPCT